VQLYIKDSSTHIEALKSNLTGDQKEGVEEIFKKIEEVHQLSNVIFVISFNKNDIKLFLYFKLFFHNWLNIILRSKISLTFCS
jgi:hypothetical protein